MIKQEQSLRIGIRDIPCKTFSAMPEMEPLEVVCGIIIHDGCVLAARRDPCRSMPLLWEFPGGKLEHGEPAEEALHRELEEELLLKVNIIKSLEPVDYVGSGDFIRLIPFLCEPAQRNAPIPVDHVEIRWIKIEQSGQLTWAPADIPLVSNLSKLINNPT